MSNVVAACQAYIEQHYEKYQCVPTPMEIWVTAAAWQREQSAIIKVCSGHTGLCGPGCKCSVAQAPTAEQKKCGDDGHWGSPTCECGAITLVGNEVQLNGAKAQRATYVNDKGEPIRTAPCSKAPCRCPKCTSRPETSLERAKALLNADSLFLKIAHGDKDHQNWLKNELRDWFTVKWHAAAVECSGLR